MPKARVNEDLKNGVYFVTPTIWNWYYIFDRHNRWQILADSLGYCQKHKGVEIYAYVFMLNHIHMIIRAENVSGFLRDFKKFTSKELKKNLAEHEPRVLELFCDDKQGYRFWKDDNQPKYIDRQEFLLQKLNYIHLNPVRKGYVDKAEYWKWSSANQESEIKVDRFW